MDTQLLIQTRQIFYGPGVYPYATQQSSHFSDFYQSKTSRVSKSQLRLKYIINHDTIEYTSARFRRNVYLQVEI